MKRLLNNAADFREEMIAGYTAAYGRYLRRVPGASGVIANGAPAAGRVSVVVGGGSGHYPAFYGLVGQGLASAAAIGDIFTSPSGEQCYRVGKAVDGGAGILFTFGNYSGDVLNFGMAEARLRADGVDARTVLVTDDVLSASPAEADRRRGIAGGFYVFKTAGAAAARGDSIADVEALTRHANARVRTAGVGFAGCTVPGQEEPLFTVEPGNMEVGLGIHGEPGVRVAAQPPARELAATLVETLLGETPPGAGSQVAVLVNGLGGTKYEELFVFYNDVAGLLDRAGLQPYTPLIGEFVTALDMPGMSLSLFWLDDDLRPLLDATAASPAFTCIGPDVSQTALPAAKAPGADRDVLAAAPPRVAAQDVPGGEMGGRARVALRRALATIEEMEQELGRLDAAAGDGDHGAGMVRGLRAAVAAIADSTGSARSTFTQGGVAFQNAAGGASGALVGAWLIAIGAGLPEDDAEVDAAALAAALAEALATLQRLGQAEPGDKTMVDTLAHFSAALTEAAAGADIPQAWASALPAGEAGMLATTDMVSRRGRASRLGERSRGTQDAGATSIYYVLRAFGEGLGQ